MLHTLIRLLKVNLPRTFTLLIGCLTLFIGYDYFHTPAGDMFRGHWAYCGDMEVLSGHTGSGSKNYLSLEIKDGEPGKFILSGELVLTATAYDKLSSEKARLQAMLNNLRSPSILPGIPYFLDLDTDNVTRRWNNEAVLKIKEIPLHGMGFLSDFPFDTYRLGFKPALYVSGPGDAESRLFPLDTAITNIRLSDAMAVRKAATWQDYVTDVSLDAAERSVRYKVDDCALIVNRAPWYRSMVVLLVVILIVPAVYLIYRPDDNPGVDLIAVILGVAAIRQFLLGNIIDWRLYKLDMVFVLVTVVTAAIPLWHIHRKLERQ